jgi:hypothetical protein
MCARTVVALDRSIYYVDNIEISAKVEIRK